MGLAKERSLGHRRKISTTVSPGTFAYLQSLIESGKARNLAEALDVSMSGLRRAVNRARLERDTARYFASVTAASADEEATLEAALDRISDEIDFDAY